jgi:uncharacterized protein with HEPN domain
MRSTRERLLDILKCTHRVEKYVSRVSSFDEFVFNSVTQDAILYQLTIIGEAVHRLHPPLLKKYPETDWAGLDAMRNFIVHAYHEVDLRLVWNTATHEVPALGGSSPC